MTSIKTTAASLLAAFIVCGPLAARAQTPKLTYPTPRQADVVDEYFGVKVSDPYRWMEELDSPEVADWVQAQTRLTSEYLTRLPLREHFRRRMTELWNASRTNIPLIEQGHLFYRKNSGLQRQSPLFVRAGLDGTPKLVLDPNVLSPDGSVSLASYTPAPNAKLVAYTLSEGGADWQTIRVREVESGRDLSDDIRWMRFSELSWTRDSKGFFYSRYPEPPKGKALAAELSGHALYYHRLGTSQAEDRLIYERKDLPSWFIAGWVTEDGRYLIVRFAKSAGPKNRLYYADLGNPQHPNVGAPVKPVVEDDEIEHRVFGNIGSTIYVRTDREASNRKIIAIDLRKPDRASWKTIVPEGKNAMRNIDLIGGRIVVEYLENVQSRLALFDRNGRALDDIALPEAGTVNDIHGRQDDPRVFYAFTSPLFPTTVFSYDPRSRRSTPFEPPARVADVSAYESRQFFATSKDGTRVPFTLTARKDIAKDGSTPTLLLGYGGFGISLLPVYRPHVLAWLELGGAWVSASIRGGGEYGAAWYEGARAEKRQNGFDDFIAVAEYLVKEKYTSPAKLGIVGGSNGGLLVATVSQQRSDLYAVALPAVGVFDMLRFDKFTGGHAWTREYGSPAVSAQFTALVRYSPLHNVKAGTCYPATFITTADHDDRVVPSHSFKYAAALQAAQGCDRPVLLRVEPKASHGYRPTDRLIAELADQYAFAAQQTGLSGPRQAAH